MRWKNADPQKVSFADILKVGFMLFEISIFESNSHMIVGYHLVDDLEGFSFSYLKGLFPFLIRRIMTCIVKGYPLRLKSAQLFNCPFGFATIVNLIKPLIPKKILSRVSRLVFESDVEYK